MTRKVKNIVKFTAFLLAGIALFLLGHFTTIHHSLTGTYGSGTPDVRSIYVVLDADDRFTIYDQNAVRASGRCEAVAQDEEVYALVDDAGGKVGYVVQNGEQILLLGFDDTEQLLEKISDDALYKNFDAGI